MLVPLTEWRRLKDCQLGIEEQQGRENVDEMTSQTHLPRIVETQEEEKDKQDFLNTSRVENIVALLSKPQRSRAKIILHFIISKLDVNNRLTYDNGVKSSHIIDLLRFVLNPLNKRAPRDANDFCHFLKTVGVPDSVYTCRLSPVNHNIVKIPWLTL